MNSTELFVKNIYYSLDIIHPYNLSIKKVAKKLNLSVIYWSFGSEISFFDGIYKVFINKNLNDQRQWQDFGHEMSHYFRDRENQRFLTSIFINYCESKADYFSYHFCVPTFMLMQLREVTIYDVMSLFNVEYDFAYKRLEMYQNKLISKGEYKWRKDMPDTVVATDGN